MNRVVLRASQTLIRMDLENLRDYASTVEEFFSKELEALQLSLKKDVSKQPKEEREAILALQAEDHWQLSEVFPRTLRYSLFILCYSLLEHHLLNLCKHIEKTLSDSVTLDDLRGRGIRKAQTYLKKVAKIEFPDKYPFWNNICHYNLIRNFIAHKNGRLDKSKDAKKVKSFINSKSSIGLGSHDQIQLSEQFIPEVIDDLDEFFEQLFEALEKKFERTW